MKYNRVVVLKIFGLIAGLLILSLIALFVLVSVATKPERAANLPCRNIEGGARCIKVNGFDLWYRETGNRSGKTVIVLHGGTGMSSHYFGDSFKFLEKDYRVILYDQRGSSYSQIKPDLSFYTFDSLVNELEAIRRDIADSEKVIIVGHSFGGLVAQRYAFAYPDRVDRLVLVSPAYPKLNRQTITRPFRLLLKHGLPPSDPEKANEYFMGMFETLFKGTFYDMNNYLKFSPGYASYATSVAVRNSLGKFDFREDIKKVKTKTLILYGGEAEIETCVEEYQLKLHKLISNSTLVKFEKSGHWSFLEEPERFQKTVKEFLRDSE
jgi:proline iminopeptidase